MSRREIVKVVIGVVLGGFCRAVARKASVLTINEVNEQEHWSYGPGGDGKSLFAWEIIEKCRREEGMD